MTAGSQRLERGRGGEHLVHGRFVRDRAPAVVADTLLHEVRPAALTKDLEVDVPTRAVGDDKIAIDDRGGVEETACEQRRHHTCLCEEHRARILRGARSPRWPSLAARVLHRVVALRLRTRDDRRDGAAVPAAPTAPAAAPAARLRQQQTAKRPAAGCAERGEKVAAEKAGGSRLGRPLADLGAVPQHDHDAAGRQTVRVGGV